MNNALKQLAWIIISMFIIGLLALTYHITKRNKKFIDSTPSFERMLGAKLTEYNQDGYIRNTLIAKDWSNQQDNSYSTLTRPDLTIFRKDGTKWNITSNNATLLSKEHSNSIEEIILTKNVNIYQAKSDQHPGTEVKTEVLHYFPGSEDFTSDKKVELKQPGLIIQGKGITGNLGTENVKLHKDVSTKYVPATKSS